MQLFIYINFLCTVILLSQTDCHFGISISLILLVYFLQTSRVRPFAVAAILRNTTFTKVSLWFSV